MPPPLRTFTLEELKEMFITQRIFREETGKIYKTMDINKADIIEHMDQGFESVRGISSKNSNTLTNHKERLKSLECNPTSPPHTSQRVLDKNWVKLAILIASIILALLTGSAASGGIP